jgi:hypothetical protein
MASQTNMESSYVPIRIPNETLARIAAIVDRSAQNGNSKRWNVSSWIKSAIAEKLAHAERARRKKKKAAPAPEDEIEEPEPGEIYAANQVA